MSYRLMSTILFGSAYSIREMLMEFRKEDSVPIRNMSRIFSTN